MASNLKVKTNLIREFRVGRLFKIESFLIKIDIFLNDILVHILKFLVLELED